MSQGANVRSVDAIKDFKITLINFAEEARVGLSSTDMELRQVRNWLTRDQLTYWQSQVKRGQERVSMAKAELHRRQLSQANSESVSDTDQKDALRDALRQLREAEEKVQVIKRWIPMLEHAVSEYHSQSQPLGDRLAGSFAQTLNIITRMITALDAYLKLSVPTGHARPESKARATGGEAKSGVRSSASTGPAPEGEAQADATDGPATAPAAGEAAASTSGAEPAHAEVETGSESR
jgi:hypothetical protein